MKASPGLHSDYYMLGGQHYCKITPLIYNLGRILHIHFWKKTSKYGKSVCDIHSYLPEYQRLLRHNPATHCSTAGTCVHATFGICADLCAVQSSASYHGSGFFADRRDGKNAVQCSIHIWLYLRGRNNHLTKKNLHSSQLTIIKIEE